MKPSTVTVEHVSMHELNEEKEQTDEGDIEDENLKVPVELMMELLRALMNSSFQLASKLCEMILIYEPDNLKAFEFHSLIQKMLQQKQEAEKSSKKDQEEDDDDNDDEDTDSKKESSDSSSSSSSSSSSPSEDEEDQKKQVESPKHCPLSDIL